MMQITITINESDKMECSVNGHSLSPTPRELELAVFMRTALEDAMQKRYAEMQEQGCNPLYTAWHRDSTTQDPDH